MTNPLSPTGVTISARAGYLVINWNAPNGRTDLTYEIEVSVFDNDLLPTIYPSASMSFTLNVPDTARRFFRVRCVDTAQSRSTWSATISKAATPPGTFTEGVDLDMSNHTLLNLSDPVLAQEPATKAYVDAHSGGNSSGQAFPPSGDLAMGSHRLTGLADPVSAQDAATQAYVLAHGGSNGLLSVRPQGGTALTNISVIEFATGTTVSDLTGGVARVTPATGGSSGYIPDPRNIDNPPASPNALDDEFNGTSLDSKWTWVNQGATTIALSNSRAVFYGTSDLYNSFIIQPISGSAWEVAAQLTINGGSQYASIPMYLYNSSNGYFYNWGANGGFYQANRWSPDYSRTDVNVGAPNSPSVYLKMALASGVLSFFWSVDGVQYVPQGTVALTTWIGTVTHVGIGAYRSGIVYGSCNWFRRLA